MLVQIKKKVLCKQDLDFILLTSLAEPYAKDQSEYFCNFDFQVSFSGNFQYATGVFYLEISIDTTTAKC